MKNWYFKKSTFLGEHMMMAGKVMKSLVLLVMIIGAASVAMADESAAQSYAGEPAAHFHEIDNAFMDAFHNPMEGVTMGLDLRLREVYNRNLISGVVDDAAGEDRHWQRYRLRWSTKWAISEDIDFNTRLTWESWTYCLPESGPSHDFREGIFDHMNIQFRNAFDLPLTLTVGRQDIILGTGWLVLDGTPADGSRTIFFDAVRAQYDLSDTSKLDLIYIQQYDDEDKWIQPFNHNANENLHLTQQQDERAFISYWHNKLNDTLNNELYYIYKNDEGSDWSGGAGDNADIHTIGTRFFGSLDDNWSYSAEIAKQWGSRNGDSLQALGSNSKLTYAFNNDLSNEIHVGYEYMSGDDPDTSKDEQFDTLWGDWPQYQRGGDLQSYLWTPEGALGEVTNLHRFGVGHSFKPAQNWTLLTDYNLMWADENSESATPGFSSDGNFRGHMLTGLLTYQCCKKFRTQFLLDYFIPGGYYEDPKTDDAFFARVNMEWTF